MRNYLIVAFSAMLFVACSGSKPKTAEVVNPKLCDAFPDYTIGVALNVNQSSEKDASGVAIVKQHFNSIVPENCMKCEEIHPEENTYFWDDADRFVKFGEDNNMQIIGHCLIWHSQCAPWFFVDAKGKLVKPEVLKQRMKDHITTIMTRYKGRITGYDVVNEAILDDGSYRPSLFYKILGEEFIPWAFQCAMEADPDAELYYNDYSMAEPGKRAGVVGVIKKLKERGIRIDAVGMQSHMGMDHPSWEEFEASIKAFIGAGVDVQFTEVDMSALPSVNFGANVSDTEEYRAELNPYANGLPDDVSAQWNERMSTFFSIVDKYAKNVRRVTAWGVTDADSWKNDWPIEGRTDYTLWFDRQGQMKPFLVDRMKKKGLM
jgi:endo-1,4-beta-xylanase